MIRWPRQSCVWPPVKNRSFFFRGCRIWPLCSRTPGGISTQSCNFSLTTSSRQQHDDIERYKIIIIDIIDEIKIIIIAHAVLRHDELNGGLTIISDDDPMMKSLSRMTIGEGLHFCHFENPEGTHCAVVYRNRRGWIWTLKSAIFAISDVEIQ